MKDIAHLRNRVYYAQNREDLILRAFFPDIKKGFYVDVGGYDPEFESVTKYFYQKGWRGINIEPQPERLQKFTEKRPRDINLNIGISDKQSTLTLRSYSNQGLSTFSDTIKEGYIKDSNKATDHYKDIRVKVMTLEKVFDENKVDHIHFLKVDVEGLEDEVLNGNNWNKYRPEVICIEANHIVNDWHKLLKDSNYELVFFDGLNEYYADKNTIRKKIFSYVDLVVLEWGGGVRSDDFNLMNDIQTERNEFHDYAHHLSVEINKKNEEIEKHNKQILQQEQTLLSIKKSTFHLCALLKKRMLKGSKRNIK